MSINDKNAKGISTLIVVIVAVILAVVLFKDLKGIFDGFMETLGLKDSKEESENKAKVNNAVNAANNAGSASAWSPGYWKLKANAQLFTKSKTDSLVKTLWDSVGYFVDTPSKADGVIKQCRYKSQVSWLADNFQQKYEAGLLAWMNEHFDTSDQKEYLAGILRYVESLPSGLS